MASCSIALDFHTELDHRRRVHRRHRDGRREGGRVVDERRADAGGAQAPGDERGVARRALVENRGHLEVITLGKSEGEGRIP